jgi:hypothetical protein
MTILFVRKDYKNKNYLCARLAWSSITKLFALWTALIHIGLHINIGSTYVLLCRPGLQAAQPKPVGFQRLLFFYLKID